MSGVPALVERLVLHINKGDPESLRRELDSSEKRREKAVNFPIARYNNWTVVHLAASKGQLECLKILLKNGGDPNALSSRADLSQTPLHVAAYHSYPTLIEVLLQNGADMSIRNSHLATAQDLAAGKHKCETVFQHEIAKNRIPDRTTGEKNRVQELHELISLDQQRFRTLYDNLPPHYWDLATRWTDFFNQTILYRAANEQASKLVEFILSKSPNQPLHNLADHRTPLVAACHQKNLQISKMLLEHSPRLIFVKEKRENESPLHIACRHGCMDIVILILEALKLCMESHDDEKSNCTLNFIDKQGKSPLYCACEVGNYEIVKLLTDFHRENSVQLNVNVAVRDLKRTPLQAAIQSGNLDITKELLSVQSIEVNRKGRPSSQTISKLMSLREEAEASGSQQVPHMVIQRRETDKSLQDKSSDSSNLKKEIRKRSQTEAPSEVTDGDVKGIFEHTETGELVILTAKESQGNVKHVNLNRVLISPLSEAAAYADSKVMELLLAHGAHDDNGLACRILFFINRSDLAHTILTYHVSCSYPTSWRSKSNPGSLVLKWDHKRLPDTQEEWFDKNSTFHLYTKEVDDETVQTLTTRISDIGQSDVKNRLVFMPILPHHLSVIIDSLSSIALSHNQLKSLPYQLFQLPNLQVLDVSCNKIQELPTSSSSFKDTLADHESTTVTEMWHCQDLQELNVSGNKLIKLPFSLWQLKRICILDCSKNNITMIDPGNCSLSEIPCAPMLENLNLSKNCLSGKIPDFVFQLPSLKELDLSNNKIEELPTSMWNNENITKLNFANNQLRNLPLCEPESVYQQLHLNRIKNTNPFHAGISSKETYSRSGQPDLAQPSAIKPDYSEKSQSSMKKSSSIISVTHSYKYSALSKLNISGNLLSVVPEGLPCFAPNLEDLDISNNIDLKEIDIMFLPSSLKILSAVKCSITSIGNIISSSDRARVLQNCRHQSSISQECSHRSHCYLQSLSKLKLSGNKMSNIQLIRHNAPEKQMEASTQADSESVFIQFSFDLLYPYLSVLHLDSNALTGTFNPNIGHQKKLKQVDLSDNPSLEAIPMEFAYLMRKRRQELSELKLEKLPHLVDPPTEYRTASLNHLLGYMKSKLKASDCYRTIKLFFVGNGERGKTTLLRRLRGLSEDRKVNRTVGIDIEPWIFPNKKNDKRNPVKFLAWDFAGQDVYHTTHQCFYSKRSIYLALFRLIDGIDGIEELHEWLKCINLRAPGCPVIIVGTHLDQLHDQQRRVQDLEEEVYKRYCSGSSSYPKVVDVRFISCLKKRLVKNRVKDLRNKIYEVACHLALDGSKLLYIPNMPEESSRALFQQKVPLAFLTLQEHIERKVHEIARNNMEMPPVMEEEQFREAFLCAVDDEEELEEAVFFLHLQGSILHFDDHNLKHVYFLDPQWLPKMMADVIHPATKDKESVAEIKNLFCHRSHMSSMKDHFINYMEKFEVVVRINSKQVIIPCSLKKSEQAVPEEILPTINTSTYCDVEGECYPPLRRFWISNFVPDGFWPRLTCAVFKDPQIDKILKSLIGFHDSLSTTSYNVTNFKSYTSLMETSSNLHINVWKTGFTFGYQDKILFMLMQDNNIEDEVFSKQPDKGSSFLKSKFRIELHVFVNEFMTVGKHLLQTYQPQQVCASSLATRLLLLLTEHVKKLAADYFGGMIKLPGTVFCSYMMCWKCLSNTSDVLPKNMSGMFILKDDLPRRVYIVEDQICIETKKQYVDCCFHGRIPFKEQAPELIFWDLANEVGYDSNSDLDIFEDEALGKGAFGIVYKGDLHVKEQESTINVAVKIFLPVGNQQRSLGELSKELQEPTKLLRAYQEIRQEVSFISILRHPNLTQLCGVRTSPYLCLVLEMAPGKSLDIMLKDYYDCNEVLEPVVLKESALQMAQGLEYLHINQRVHLDMKSSNVLIWKFPSPHISRADRLKQSKSILLKIADYGISQVSIGLTLSSITSGTPGYMAPEILMGVKSRISSEKLDVFAYGMVLFELLNQTPPFQNSQDPNMEVRENSRPQIDPRKAQSLVLLQELICRCWHQDPEMRPTMKDVVQYVRDPEFDQLRDEELLENVSSISCACACRICPDDNDQNVSEYEAKQLSATTKPIHNLIIPSEKIMKINLDTIGNMESLVMYRGRSDTLPSSSNEQSVHIGDSKDGEKIASMRNFSFSRKSTKHSLRRNKGPLKKNVGQSSEGVNLKSKDDAESEISVTDLNPYSQIWLCSNVGRRKSILKIFTFVDEHPGHYSFSGNFPGDGLTCICAVHNMMWMGTAEGDIVIFQARTLQVKFACTLKAEESNKNKPRVLKIVYVQEKRSVLVSTSFGEIWSFYDIIIDECLQLQCILFLNSPCYDLVKVPTGNGQIVYGAMDNNQIVVLEQCCNSVWTERTLIIKPDEELSTCYHIVYAPFTMSNGIEVKNVWISYKLKPILITWDISSEKPVRTQDCALLLKENVVQPFRIADMICVDHKIIVGISTGGVGILDAESACVLQFLRCHESNFYLLLSLPPQVAPTVCVEVPLSNSAKKSARSGISTVENYQMIGTVGIGRQGRFVQEQTSTRPSTSDKTQSQQQSSDMLLQIWTI